jgi:hypothetical protein
MKMLSRLGSVLLASVAIIFLVGAEGLWPAARTDISRNQPRKAPVQLSGQKAREYLDETSDGRSLMQALTAARFGLQWQEHATFDEKSGAGYLGMSHEQNLNAWFANDGVTVRPTVPEAKRDQTWNMALRLRAYGYGKQLVDVPQIVSRQVKENRIEYVRQNQRPVSDFSNRKAQIENRKLIEWYENKAEGIEQGFTLNERPAVGHSERSTAESKNPVMQPAGNATGSLDLARDDRYGGAPEPLRVLLAVTGDLRARPKDEATIELVDKEGKGALSYSKLVAQDADGKRLAARMEASADGREIALVVEDAGARYPIVIDPIVASLEQQLDAGSGQYTGRQTDARFGFAVAIDGENAVVGAWRELGGGGTLADAGAVYFFTRTGSSWSGAGLVSGNPAGYNCGWSVAISGSNAVYGCPGANSDTGRAFLDGIGSGGIHEFIPPSGSQNAGDEYGTSVAISGNNVVVGAPLYNGGGSQPAGAAYTFVINSDLSITAQNYIPATLLPGGYLNFGTSVAIDGDTFVVGAPGSNSSAGKAAVFSNVAAPSFSADLIAGDGSSDDEFGQSVGISFNTAVVGAPFNRDRGANAGAAYVFVRDPNGNWSQQQKLLGSDAYTDGDVFGASHIAIQDNTIVVGAYGWEPTNNINDDNGKAYIFMRSGTVWTEQTRVVGDNQVGDNFGVGLGLSGDTVIAGARGATATGVAGAGAAYVYRLSCVPPSGAAVFFDALSSTKTACPGSSVTFNVSRNGDVTPNAVSFQWRKNGVNIPGATTAPYIISNVSASDAGSYDVIVSNACGSDISSPATLAVHTFSLNPTSQNFGVSGSTGIVNVTSTGSTCSWTAVSKSSFITVNSGSSGTGNGTVGFTVAANPNSGQRTGTITIAGKTFSVSQDGTNCSYSIAPISKTLSASASTNMVNVTTGAGCAWTATSHNSFLSINSGASGSGNGTVTYTIAANFNTTQRTGTLTIAAQTFTVTQAAAAATPTPTPTPTATPKSTPTPTPSPKPGLVGNVSTRLPVGTGDNVLIEGFIVQGPVGSTKKIIVRAIGPSLAAFGITDALANPTLEIHDANNATVARNNDWKKTQLGGLITSDQSAAISASQVAPSNDLESAVIVSLAPGSYTAVVRGLGNTVGTGVVDAYDLSAASPARLANISTRGLIQPGDKLMIAGFIIQNGPVKAVICAIGPSLTAFGITNALPDTTLQLRNQNGTILIENDNWKVRSDGSSQQAELEATSLQPTNDLEAALIATIQPGQYTAQVRGKGQASGIGVVQVYFLQ